jgi:fructose-1,6-bisphosphatase/inositol monophosphatase family enzyme
MHMEGMIDRVVLEISNEAGNVDDRHGGQATVDPMDDRILLEVLDETASAIGAALGNLDDWGLAGTRDGQYHSDLAADAAALAVLERAGVGVLSEESGRHRPDAEITVVLDPLDGSTNASRGIPWYATSLCAVDADGARASLVINLATGDRFEAVRGGGATRNGKVMTTSGATKMRESLVALSGYPDHWLGWYQFRSLGACALDLCAVACGVVDGYIDCSWNAHGSWDYLGGLLVCQEAGAVIVDAEDRDLVVLEHADRRTPVAAATPELLTQLVDARRSIKRP